MSEELEGGPVENDPAGAGGSEDGGPGGLPPEVRAAVERLMRASNVADGRLVMTADMEHSPVFLNLRHLLGLSLQARFAAAQALACAEALAKVLLTPETRAAYDAAVCASLNEVAEELEKLAEMRARPKIMTPGDFGGGLGPVGGNGGGRRGV